MFQRGWIKRKTDTDTALIQDLADNLDPFSTRNPFDWTDSELTFLDNVANAQIVGVGEATHGTKEFFEAKHRIFQYLVENHGYKVFAIEADVRESIYLNDRELINKSRSPSLSKSAGYKLSSFWKKLHIYCYWS